MPKIVEKDYCPSCGNYRKISEFKFGVIRTTLCTFCLELYLHQTLNPVIEKEMLAEQKNIHEEGLKK